MRHLHAELRNLPPQGLDLAACCYCANSYCVDNARNAFVNCCSNAVIELPHSLDSFTAYIETCNRVPKPFVWTATVKGILAEVDRVNAALAAPH